MICRSYNCTFVHIPKTAGRSVESFFLQRLGLDRENDAESRELVTEMYRSDIQNFGYSFSDALKPAK
jgi:hypothetical protein